MITGACILRFFEDSGLTFGICGSELAGIVAVRGTERIEGVLGGRGFWYFLNVVHDDLPSLTRAGYRSVAECVFQGFVDRHGIAVIFASDSDI